MPHISGVKGRIASIDATPKTSVTTAKTKATSGAAYSSDPVVSKHFVAGGSFVGHRATGSALVDLVARQRLETGTVIGAGDLDAIYARIQQVRVHGHVAIEELGRVEGMPIHALHFGCTDPENPPKLRVLVTAGVHGNEVSGPAAAVLVMDRLLAHPEILRDVEVTIILCINPVGYLAGTRRNGDDIDINREFKNGDAVPLEVAIVRRLIDRGQFDLGLDLHSAKPKRDGFFVLHRNSLGLMREVMQRLSRTIPVLSSAGGSYVYDAPGVYHSTNRGTLKDYVHDKGAPQTATIEAPQSMSYRSRSRGMADIVLTAIDVAKKGRGGAGDPRA